MTSEIRTNSITSRAGMSTVTMTDSGPMFSGITTFVDNSGFTFGVGGGTSIFTPATNVLTFGTNNTEKIRIDASGHMHGVGVITATHFYGDGSNLTGLPAGTTITNNANNRVITGSDTSNTLIAETGLTYNTQTLLLNNTSANPQFHLTSAANGICEVKFGDANDATRGNIIYRNGTSGEALCFHGYNNTERMRITSDGGIGIGTTNPYVLNEPAKFNELTIGGKTEGAAITLRDDNGNVKGNLFTSDVTGAMSVRTITNHDLHFRTNNTDRMIIDSSGRVLIGTTTEGAVSANNFTIASSSYCGMTIRSGTSSEGNIFFSDATSGNGESVGMLRYEHANDAMVIKTANAERLRIKSDGKVVIGTNAAGAKLSVSGNLITDDGTNARITLQADGTSTNQIMSTTTGFGSYCNMSYQAAAHIFKYGGTETFRINADGTFSGKPDQINGRTDNEVLGGKSFKYDTSNISPSWGSGSNGWYSFYHMADGVYTFWLHTNAHSSICFTASNGYDPSLKSYITVHHFINNPNGNYGNIKGIRITDDGIVQAYIHASASNQYFSMYVQVTCGDLTNMPPLYATLTKETGSPSINDSWGTSDAYSPARGAHTTDGVCSPRILHNRQEMSCFATSTSLYGANTSGAKGFYWDPGTASCQSAQPRNTGWSSYYINKHDGNGGSENRYIDFWLNNGQQGNITISGSGLNYGSNSDYRLKKDDVGMTDGIARVKQLRPIKFKWIKDDIDDEGFFAHEAQAVVPIAVDGTKDQVVLQSEVDAGSQREDKSAGDPIYQTMDNSKLVPVLTASIKELITKVETLEQENIALRARVTNLEGN